MYTILVVILLLMLIGARPHGPVVADEVIIRTGRQARIRIIRYLVLAPGQPWARLNANSGSATSRQARSR